MTPSRRAIAASHERGAATAMLALFLLVMAAFALLIALNMGASDITDSAAHNDATEALFLAESGLERASKRFADGIPCADLAEPAIPLGRGTFTIQAAEFTANICRITVLGTVRAANRVIRGDATTLLYEPFPDANSLIAWPETVIKKKGESKFDAASALADNTGSLIMQTDKGKIQKFEAYRQRTLQNNIAGPQTVTLNLAYKKKFTGVAPKDQKLGVYLAAADGTLSLVAEFKDKSKADVWVDSGKLSFNVPAGTVIEGVRLYYKLESGNSNDSQVFIWADNVRLTTSAELFPLKAWTEVVR